MATIDLFVSDYVIHVQNGCDRIGIHVVAKVLLSQCCLYLVSVLEGISLANAMGQKHCIVWCFITWAVHYLPYL